ncbi:MAG: radical SAM protein [candidate division KSB1 bacterium]|nr:radical SAM protein [candidate division KSB1 bacterium]MDZ7274060.1 radical SAM protein [candidate division KSB1 bacterium]MDZ7287894.1 radical SAM protein [candidate division KSB1 bacterium]MDZ7296660.1 radical SAM protein [candidate division KSB1 bacterium]MDZ7307277.1 radical SAM protein [candidate division KSB1 bacterium]
MPDPACWVIRRTHFPDHITFHTPGLKGYKTSEYDGHNAQEFVSISITGTACALGCEHCKMSVLKGMMALPQFEGSLFDLCAALARRGARGVLISGGSDRQGRVPLLPHIPDMIRVRRELGLALRVHVGLPDEETCEALAKVGIDGAMIDVIGHQDTIREVYHLDSTPEAYETALEHLARHNVPTVPHIILGLHFGRMLGEWRALEMIARHPPKILVLVILMPLNGTPMAVTRPPSLDEIGNFFATARKTLPATPVMLGCARPLGQIKFDIDRLAIDAGLNGIAYPAEGIVDYARQKRLTPNFINACCGVTW